MTLAETETFEKLSTLSTHRVRAKEIETNRWGRLYQLGGELVDARGSMLTATAQHGMPGFWSGLLQLEHFIRFQRSGK